MYKFVVIHSNYSLDHMSQNPYLLQLKFGINILLIDTGDSNPVFSSRRHGIQRGEAMT